MPTFAPQIERWRPLVTRYWGALADVGLAIISFEAPSGDPGAHNTSGEDSRGLFQINVAPGAHPQWASLDLFDPETNVAKSVEVWNSQGPFAWSVWPRAATLLGLPLNWREPIGSGQLPTPDPAKTVVPSGSPIPDKVTVGGGGVSGLTTTPAGLGGFPFTVPSITVPNIDWKTGLELPQGFASLALTLAQLPNAIAAPFVGAVNNAAALMAFVGQTHIWERLGLVLLGVLLVVIGIVLFALSFVDRSTVRTVAGAIA
jgi:hypothetical protein